MSQPRKSCRKKRQTQLSFSPLPSSSPAASHYPEQIQQRAAAVRYDSDMSPTKKRRVGTRSQYKLPFSPASSAGKQRIQVVIPSPCKTSQQLPTPAPSSQVRVEEIANLTCYFEDDQGDSPLNSKSKGRATGANDGMPILGDATKVAEGNHILGSDDEDTSVPTRVARRARAVPVILSSEDESDDRVAQEPVTPKKRPRKHHGVLTQSSTPSSLTDVEPTIKQWGEHLSLSPDSQSSSITSPPKTSPPAIKDLKKKSDAFVISSGDEHNSSEDDIVTPARRRRNQAEVQTTPRSESSQGQDTQDHIVTPARRRRIQAVVQTTPGSELSQGEDTQESDDDVTELSDSLIRKNRTRGKQENSERSKRQRKLEELRLRRAGIRAQSVNEESEQSGTEGSESGLEPMHLAMRRGDDLDKYEDDFLDDENDTLGVDLGVAGVPLEFTYHANKKPFEHFKAEVEWMVHNKLNPAFDRRDEIYLLAHEKLDKEVEQFGSAKFQSSVWKEPFVRALKSRPEISRVDVPTMLEHKCDACQRSNHPPKHKVTFAGKPYNRDTLEALEHDDDDDDDDDENDDSHESSVSDDEENFFLGRFCCANAEMAHACHHWRYALNQVILSWLADDGQLTPEKIVERASMRQKKQEKASNKVVDRMVTTGVMKQLYRQFKENLEAARDAKPQRFSNRN